MLEGKDQDPDYNEAAPPDRKRLKHLEDNARSHLGERVKHILDNHFELEVNQQHNQIQEIDKCIAKVQQKLQILRYVATRSFFSPKSLQHSNSSSSVQSEMHPAVKSMLGKRPAVQLPSSTMTVPPSEELIANSNTANLFATTTNENLKIPRYIPPTLPEQPIAAPVRGEFHCSKKKLVIGNVSRWIPISERDDTASHKWMVYVRGSKEEPNVSSFVSQVVFFLHPSYAPHDIVRVSCHPFHVTRRGWGEFPLRIQVHFHNPLCKPVNIIHHLKLDRSYSGLQTLGAETIVDVMVYDNRNQLVVGSPFDNDQSMELDVKTEPFDAEDEPPNLQPVNEIKIEPIEEEEEEEEIEPPIVDQSTAVAVSGDHDYFSSPATNGGRPSPSTSTTVAAQEKPKPILVRCFNKNGTVVKLPLSLLRSAVILQPFRGESLLRPQFIAGGGSKICLTKAVKADTPCKQVSAETKLINERHNLETSLEAIGSSQWKSVRDCVRALARILPLVDAKAEDPVYRSVRPFSSPSQEAFASWSVGKRRSAEWTRAKLIRNTLLKCNGTDLAGHNLWSTKAIMNWCRRQGYSPVSCWTAGSHSRSTSPSANSCPDLQTLTKAQLNHPPSIASEDDVTIDVESCKDRPVIKSSTAASGGSQLAKMAVVINDADPDLTSWIADSMEKHGFKLGTECHEEVCLSLSRLLLSHLWKSVAEDLLRRSLRQSCQRNGNAAAAPDQISLVDSFRAITRRPQFDILTNAGLAIDDNVHNSLSS